jgi:hypothetical protein
MMATMIQGLRVYIKLYKNQIFSVSLPYPNLSFVSSFSRRDVLYYPTDLIWRKVIPFDTMTVEGFFV